MPVARLHGLRHYFRLEGHPEREPLLLVHPIGADHSLFDKLVPLLTGRYQVLRPDLRGHGGTETPAVDCTLADLSADLLALADAVGWRRFTACGVSLGAMASLHTALIAPDRVGALVLCSSAPVMAPPPGGWEQRAQVARSQGMAALAPAMVERMFSPEHRASGDAQVETLRTVFLRTDPAGYAACVAVLRDADLRESLPQVRAPAWILRGSHDPLITPEKVQALHAGLAGSHLQEIACGHFPPVEAPAEFARVLLDLPPDA